jgi:hypothetical protein
MITCKLPLADTSGVSYQWYFGGTNIPGATSDTLLITNVSTANQGFYFVVVSNALGAGASTLANLYIDSRGCGLPDSWQLQYFGNLNQNALGDFDGSGDANLQDFVNGTNPTNAASALYQITLLNDGGAVVVSPNQPAYTNGQVVTLRATGSSSAPFHAWTGDVVTRRNAITVTMTTNRTLFAHFLPFTIIWTNIVGGDWNVAANWTPNLVPGSNESVVLAIPATVMENSNVDLVDFTFGNSLYASELTGSGRITIAGTGNWNAGTMGGTGTTVVLPRASLALANSSSLALNRTLENAGSVEWAGGNFAVGGVITNDAGAQFQIFGPASFIGPEFDNAGTLFLANNAATTFAGAFNDYGTINFPGGTLTLSGGGILASSLSVPAGSAITLQAGVFTSTSNLSLTGPGTLIVNGGVATLAGTVNVSGSNIFTAGSVDFSGNCICTNNSILISGGSASFDARGVIAPAFLALGESGSALGGSQNVTVTRAMTWTAGSMNGTGWTIIPPGATLTISNSSFISMASRTLDNGGTTVWNGAGNLTVNGGVITNEPGALFQVQSSASIIGGGSPRFDNAGVFRKSASPGTFTLYLVAFTNYGMVDIQSGVLDANLGGYASSANATLNCAIGGPVAGANYGQLQVSGAVNLNGTLSVNLTNYIPATNNSFTLVTAGARDGTFSKFIYPSNQVSMILSNTATAVIVRATDILAVPLPLLLPPQLSGTNFSFSLQTASNQSYTIQQNTNLSTTNWLLVTNFTGDGSLCQFMLPLTNGPRSFFRVRQP